MAVDLDRAVVHVVEAGDEVRRRRLAGARRPDERDELAGLRDEVDPLEREPPGGTPGAGSSPPSGSGCPADAASPASASSSSADPRIIAASSGAPSTARPSPSIAVPTSSSPARAVSSCVSASSPAGSPRCVCPLAAASIARDDGIACAGYRNETSWRRTRPRRVVGSRTTASGASTISGSRSRYSKIRSKSARAPANSTCTLRSWPRGKNRRLWSVVNATMSPIVGAPGLFWMMRYPASQ